MINFRVYAAWFHLNLSFFPEVFGTYKDHPSLEVPPGNVWLTPTLFIAPQMYLL
jgi:hypothetical protein